MRRGGRGVQRISVRQPFLFGQQFQVLADRRLRLLDLGEAATEILGLPRPAGGQGGELLQLRPDVAVPLVDALIVGQQRRQPGTAETVERLALAARSQ